MDYTIGKIFLFVSLILSVAAVIYVYLVAENKVLINEKVQKEEILYTKNNILAETLVEIQIYSSEERIVEYAKNNLGLVRDSEVFDKIIVDKKQVNSIVNLVNGKYE